MTSTTKSVINLQINQITPKGLSFSFIYVFISLIAIYSDQYLNLIPSLNKNGDVSFINESDSLLLCVPILFAMFFVYFSQPQSITKDVPTKHLILITINQGLSLIQGCLHFISLWRLGIIIKSIVNALSIVLLCFVEKLLFKKKLFTPDYLGITLILISISCIFPYKFFGGKSNKQTNATYDNYIIGIILEILSCICSTVTSVMGEYICKIDYEKEMIKYFGSKNEAQKHMINPDNAKMNTSFWLGVNGIIGLPLSIFFIVILHFYDGIIDVNNFIIKLESNYWLLCLFIIGSLLVYCKSYVATEVQVHVSSMAKKILRIFCKIPSFFINIFIARDPTHPNKYLDSFDVWKWNEWFLILSFLLSIIGVLVYYEIFIPEKYKRCEINVKQLQPNGETINTNSTDVYPTLKH